MLEARGPDQIICGQVGRADADDVAIALVVVDIVRPSASGAALATRFEPMTPPAPVTFSTMIC
jgi:DNA-binding LytR/AlgR family response regulator